MAAGPTVVCDRTSAMDGMVVRGSPGGFEKRVLFVGGRGSWFVVRDMDLKVVGVSQQLAITWLEISAGTVALGVLGRGERDEMMVCDIVARLDRLMNLLRV